MNLLEILSIVVLHWIFDFVLQTEEEAINKSKDLLYLLRHTIKYSYCWIFTGIIITLITIYNYPELIKEKEGVDLTVEMFTNILLFGIVTLIFRTSTDYFTSRFNKTLLPKRDLTYTHVDKQLIYFPKGENYHNFFVKIGFDQVLYYFQLFTTYYLLFRY